MGSRSNMVTMLLPAGAIGPLTGLAIDELAGEMTGIRVDMIAEVAINLAGVVPSSCASDMRTGV